MFHPDRRNSNWTEGSAILSLPFATEGPQFARIAIAPLQEEITPPLPKSRRGTVLRFRSEHAGRRGWRLSLVLALTLCGLALFGRGLWIFVKARAAQVLLEAAWQKTLSGDEAVKPWPWADTTTIARLRIPRYGASSIVLAGASGRTLAFGPSHLDGTAEPGADGNCVISAHRDTHFSVLQRVVVGDRIVIEAADGERHDYLVRATFVVDESDRSVLRDVGRKRLTLLTCYPFDAILPGGPLRWVVVAERAR